MYGEMDEMFASMGSFTKAFGMDQMSMGNILGFYGISAFIRRGNLGIGLGLAAIFYFLNIIANLLSSELSNRICISRELASFTY